MLAAGDFDGDGFDDLAVGIPDETVEGLRRAGAAELGELGTDHDISIPIAHLLRRINKYIVVCPLIPGSFVSPARPCIRPLPWR
ncbi:MAG: hypothetical protein ACREVJ_04640 [Gammaproteobacteria bacterium]